MKMHIIFVSLACVSMVCVTTPVEASPREARHTSIQTRASTQLKLEPKKYILSLLLWYVMCFHGMCDNARRGFPERGSSHFHADTCLLEWHLHFLVP